MKTYRTLRPIVLGDTRHEAGVEITLSDKQAAALVAAGHLAPIDAAADAAKPAAKAKPSAKGADA